MKALWPAIGLLVLLGVVSGGFLAYQHRGTRLRFWPRAERMRAILDQLGWVDPGRARVDVELRRLTYCAGPGDARRLTFRFRLRNRSELSARLAPRARVRLSVPGESVALYEQEVATGTGKFVPIDPGGVRPQIVAVDVGDPIFDRVIGSGVAEVSFEYQGHPDVRFRSGPIALADQDLESDCSAR